jgi:hypothetical protein
LGVIVVLDHDEVAGDFVRTGVDKIEVDSLLAIPGLERNFFNLEALFTSQVLKGEWLTNWAKPNLACCAP